MSRVTIAVLCTVSFVFGLGIDHFFPSLLDAQWKKEVGYEAILNAAVGLLLGLLLQPLLQKRSDEQKVEKEILIDYLKEAISTTRKVFREFRDCYESAQIPSTTTFNFVIEFRNIGNLLTYFSELQETLKVDATKCEEVKSKLMDFKEQVTGGAFPDACYTESTYKGGKRVYEELTLMMHGLLVSVNRS